MLRINYTTFPYWPTRDGALYRGGSERIFFLPNATEAHIVYSRYHSASSWLGLILTGGAVGVLLVAWRRRDRTRGVLPNPEIHRAGQPIRLPRVLKIPDQVLGRPPDVTGFPPGA